MTKKQTKAQTRTQKQPTPRRKRIPYTDNCKKCPLWQEHLRLKACEKALEDAVKAGYLDRVVE